MSKIRELRLQMGLTQRDLGEKVGVREVTLRQWEGGIRLPELRNLAVLARALGCGVGELAEDVLANYRGPDAGGEQAARTQAAMPVGRRKAKRSTIQKE